MISNNILVKTFLDLVRIDSVSGEEDSVRDYIINRLNKRGIKSEVDAAGNLFAQVDGEGEPLLLSAHMDTVEPGRGVEPIVEKGVVKSNGDTILGADNKVAVAAILHLLENLPKNHHSLEVVFSVREETEGGINHFDFSKLKSKIGILPDKDAPLGVIVDASPGIIDLRFTVTGKSAHSGRPHKGVNALMPVVATLNKLTVGQVDEKTTINFGLVNAGTARNAVPGVVYIEGEVRSFDNNSLHRYSKNICEMFERLENTDGVKVDCVKNVMFEGYEYDHEDNCMLKITDAMNSLSLEPVFDLSFGASDANTYANKGIKVVNIGDGSKDAHTTNESIEVAELEKLYELLKVYISV